MFSPNRSLTGTLLDSMHSILLDLHLPVSSAVFSAMDLELLDLAG